MEVERIVGYRITFRYLPAYEAMLSLKAYSERHKVLELGAGWFKQVAATLPPGMDQDLKELGGMGVPYPLMEQLALGGDLQDLLQTLGTMPVGELYERLLKVVDDPSKLPPDLGAQRDRMVRALKIWDDVYFGTLDPAIGRGLQAAVGEAAARAEGLAPEVAVEAITGGIILDAGAELEEVLLIPQYHCRPLNIFEWSGNRCIVAFPAELVGPAPGAVPADLRNLTRALDDDSRLLILRFLAGGVRSFSDVVKFTRLAKSTVHHHMVILRLSGLVRVYVRREGADRYSLRPEAIDGMVPRLHAFLKEE